MSLIFNRWFLIYSHNKLLQNCIFDLDHDLLTLGQLLHLIESNYVCKCHLYSFIGLCYLVEISYFTNCISDLDI